MSLYLDGRPVRYISPEEFSKFGYLQELNRSYLHPLGMALEIAQDEEDGSFYFSGVQDWRHDSSGMVFNTIDKEKTQRVFEIILERMPARMKALGYYTQPADDKEVERGVQVVQLLMETQENYGNQQTKDIVKAIGLKRLDTGVPAQTESSSSISNSTEMG